MAAAFRATTQILEESEAIVGKTAPAKWPKSDCHISKADEYGARMAAISQSAVLTLAVKCKCLHDALCIVARCAGARCIVG